MTPEFPRPVRAPGPATSPKQVAAERLRVYRRRVWTIRRRVIATTLVAFALLWAVLFVQLATGHDPALSKPSKVSTGTSSSGTAATSSGTTTGSATTTTSGATTPLTTSQS